MFQFDELSRKIKISFGGIFFIIFLAVTIVKIFYDNKITQAQIIQQYKTSRVNDSILNIELKQINNNIEYIKIDVAVLQTDVKYLKNK